MSRPTRRLTGMGKLPVVPYREPEAWVPSGGFSEFRTPEEQEQDAELAVEFDAAISSAAGDADGEPQPES